jgi:hypothetical protein
MTARDVYQAFLELSPDERAEVFEMIQGVLTDDEDDDAFIDMVNSRVTAFEAGAPTTPADQVFAELLPE